MHQPRAAPSRPTPRPTDWRSIAAGYVVVLAVMFIMWAAEHPLLAGLGVGVVGLLYLARKHGHRVLPGWRSWVRLRRSTYHATVRRTRPELDD